MQQKIIDNQKHHNTLNNFTYKPYKEGHKRIAVRRTAQERQQNQLIWAVGVAMLCCIALFVIILNNQIDPTDSARSLHGTGENYNKAANMASDTLSVWITVYFFAFVAFIVLCMGFFKSVMRTPPTTPIK